MFYGLYIDPLYLWVFFFTLIISIAAQLYVSSAYRKWGRVRNGAGLNGAQIGKRIIERTTLGDAAYTPAGGGLTVQGIRFAPTPGQLTDHYDPRDHTVHLSQGVATQSSVASMAIVAHELGHAQQHEQNSALIGMRNFLVPAVTLSPRISYICIFLGLIFNIIGLFYIGILFYGLMVVFSILTLPVEIDASRRGLRLLSESGLMLTETDRQGSRNILTAAAATYVAAAVTAILQLLYYLSIARRR